MGLFWFYVVMGVLFDTALLPPFDLPYSPGASPPDAMTQGL
jgi:hypothetical protein